MGVIGRLNQYASMLAGEFDDYSMSENLVTDNATDFNYGVANQIIATANDVAPNGLTVLCKHDLTGATQPFLNCNVDTTLTAGTYTMSMYLKGTTSFSASFAFVGETTNEIYANTANITTSWQRFTLTFTLINTQNNSRLQVFFAAQGEGKIISIWGAQLERGSVATDYSSRRAGTLISRVLSSTTNTNITGLSTYFSSGFSENVGAATTLTANVFPPYDPVYDDFGGTLFGAGQGRYMRQNTDKSVIVYNEIDEVSDFRDIVRTGLVLDLDAAQPLSYKGTGTAWNDLSGNSNNGTLVNTPTYNITNSGYFDFDYTQSENVTFASSSSLQFLNRLPYTLEAWVYPTRNPGANNWTGIFDREDTSIGSRDGYNLYFLGSATTDTFFTTERFVAGTNNNTFVTLNQSVSVNAWQHIVATYDGTTLTLYRNGSSVGTPASSTGNITNTSKTLTIAVRGGQYFGGRIANAKIYNISLSSTQVLQNYNALKHRFGL